MGANFAAVKVVATANDEDVREIYWGPLSISQSISFCLYFDDTFFGSVIIIDDFDTSDICTLFASLIFSYCKYETILV